MPAGVFLAMNSKLTDIFRTKGEVMTRKILTIALLVSIIAFLISILAFPRVSRADVDLWPLLETSEDSTTVLYPSYVHESEFLMVFPFFYRTNEGQDYHYLWPLIKVAEGRLTRAAPFWFNSEEDEYTLFPLIQQTPDYVFWSIPPIYSEKDGGFNAVFPLYVKTDDLLFAFPTVYRFSHSGKPYRLGVFPLFDYHTRPGNKAVSSLLLARREWGKDLSEWSFWPVFSCRVDEDAERFWLFPFYRSRSSDSSNTILFPLYANWANEESEALWAAPYFHRNSTRGSETSILGFFGMRSYNERATDTIKQSLWVLGYDVISIYQREETTSRNGDLLNRERRFLIFSDNWEHSGKRAFRILGIPIMERMS